MGLDLSFGDAYEREHKIYRMLRARNRAQIFLYLNKTFVEDKRKYTTTEEVMRVHNLKSISYTWNLLKEFCQVNLLKAVRTKSKFRVFVPNNLQDYEHFTTHAHATLRMKGMRK